MRPTKLRNSNGQYVLLFVVEILYKCLRQNNSAISFLFSGLDGRNATYASIALISGVGQKNPSTGCEVTAF